MVGDRGRSEVARERERRRRERRRRERRRIRERGGWGERSRWIRRRKKRW